MAAKLPTIIEESSSREPAQAKWWRINIAKLSPQELADLTGYSLQTVYLMERGINSSGQLVKPWAWRRYKMACAGAYYQILHGVEFDWMKAQGQP